MCPQLLGVIYHFCWHHFILDLKLFWPKFILNPPNHFWPKIFWNVKFFVELFFCGIQFFLIKPFVWDIFFLFGSKISLIKNNFGLQRTWKVRDLKTKYGISRSIKHQSGLRKALLVTKTCLNYHQVKTWNLEWPFFQFLVIFRH